MSRGQEAVAILQRVFGGPVDPGRALAIMVGKINSQAELIEQLKDLLAAGAFDHGVVLGAFEDMAGNLDEGEYAGWSADRLRDVLSLPRPTLRAETVTPNQPQAVKLT